MYFLHRVEIDPCRRHAAQPRSPARENFRRRVNHAFIAGNSYPAPGSVRGYPCVQLRLLRIHLRRRLLIPPRLPHPACASAGIPIYLAGIPHPARACGAPPPPRRGGVRSRAYIRGAAVPGSSPGSPRALDRGDIAIGGGADGEGELVPPPLFLTLQPSCFPSIPPQPLAGDSYTSPATPRPRLRRDTRIPRRHPPPHPRLRRSSPASSRGRGPCPGVYQVSSRARLFSGVSPCTGPWRTPPLGEAACGEEAEPSPLSLTPSGPRTSRRPCLSLRRREPGFLPAIPARGLPIQNPARDLQQLDRMGAAATKDK